MKRKIFLVVVVLLLCDSKQILPQAATYSSGNAESLYKELAQAYTVQGKELKKQDEEKILSTLSPEMRTKLEEVKKLDRNKYYDLLRYRFPFGIGNFGSAGEPIEVYGLLHAGEREKKEIELEIDVELFALKLKNADNGTHQKIRNELSERLSELFDIRELQKQNEVKKLEKRLQELKESLQVRKQKKDEIVQRRIQELLGDSKYLKWD